MKKKKKTKYKKRKIDKIQTLREAVKKKTVYFETLV